MGFLAPVFLVACSGQPEPVLTVHSAAGGLDLQANQPIRWARVTDSGGRVLAQIRPANVTRDLWIDLASQPEQTLEVEAILDRSGLIAASAQAPAQQGAVSLDLEAPLGAQPQRVADGRRFELRLPEGQSSIVGLRLEARKAEHVVVRWGADEESVDLRVAGERRLLLHEIAADTRVSVSDDEGELRFDLVRKPVSEASLKSQLQLTHVTFPADSLGRADAAYPAGRVTLPSHTWEAILRHFGFAVRAADDQVPWAWQGLTLENQGDEAENLTLRSRIVESDGQPASVFRPRLREANGQVAEVTALLRVPPHGTATAALPVFVDRSKAEPGSFTQELEVLPLGATQPLLVDRRPIVLSRGSDGVSLMLAASVLAATGGVSLVLFRGRRWLERARTSDLTTIALFGSIQFVAGVAAQLFATVTTTVIGPFAALLTGLVDDAVRMALLATLVTLLPRPGVATASLLVGTLLRLLALGSASPVDVVYIGASVIWLEGSLWASGLTRSADWRDERAFFRWARLFAGLGAASVLSAATALAVHVALYRLFYASWYVAMILLVPSWLYIGLACAIAVPFAASLRRVES